MAKPSNFLSKFLIPSSRYPFALSSGDFRCVECAFVRCPVEHRVIDVRCCTFNRIHFAMNCGALHLQPEILIYTPQNLDEELDRAAVMALQDTVQVNMEKRQVLLPKVCEWFFDDFVQSTTWRITSPPTAILRRDSGSQDLLVSSLRGQSSDVVKAVIPFLAPSVQQQLRQLLSDGGALHVRYKGFEFECRLLRKAPASSHSNQAGRST